MPVTHPSFFGRRFLFMLLQMMFVFFGLLQGFERGAKVQFLSCNLHDRARLWRKTSRTSDEAWLGCFVGLPQLYVGFVRILGASLLAVWGLGLVDRTSHGNLQML